MTEDMTLKAPIEVLGPAAHSLQRVAGLIGALGLALCLVGFFANRPQFFQSYLYAFLFWSSFAIGGLGLLLLHHVVGGRWGVVTRRLLEAAVRTLPLILLFLIPILFGLKELYIWARPEAVQQDAILQHKSAYLNAPFFVLRSLIFLGIWMLIAHRVTQLSDRQDVTGNLLIQDQMRRFSAPMLVLFVFTATFAFIDWVMSIEPHWYSTIYGAMVLIGQVLQTLAFSILVLILASGKDSYAGKVSPIVLHDLGNLMFAFTILWTYLSLSQLIIIWMGNLPLEIPWYLDRTRGSWKILTVAISVLAFVLPFLLLLSQARKRDPKRLIRIAVLVLIARAVDVFWLIEPSFRKQGFTVYWTDLAAFVGIGGIWLSFYLWQLRRRPLLPLRDIRLTLAEHEAAA